MNSEYAPSRISMATIHRLWYQTWSLRTWFVEQVMPSWHHHHHIWHHHDIIMTSSMMMSWQFIMTSPWHHHHAMQLRSWRRERIRMNNAVVRAVLLSPHKRECYPTGDVAINLCMGQLSKFTHQPNRYICLYDWRVDSQVRLVSIFVRLADEQKHSLGLWAENDLRDWNHIITFRRRYNKNYTDWRWCLVKNTPSQRVGWRRKAIRL